MCYCKNLMEHFNPGLQKLVALGNSYVNAFQGEWFLLIKWVYASVHIYEAFTMNLIIFF